MRRSRRTALAGLLAALLTAVYLGTGIAFIRASSPTADEAGHLLAGYSYLVTADFGFSSYRFSSDHPPLVRLLCALPVYLRYGLPFTPPRGIPEAAPFFRQGVSLDEMLALARIPNLLLGTLLVALIGWWAARLWGSAAAGVVALALAALDPNLVAHASLVTTDMGAALGVLLVVYLLFEYMETRSWPRLVAVGLALGLALVTKYSTLVLLPVLAAIVGGHLLAGGSVSPRPRPRAESDPLGGRILAALLPAAVVLVLAALVIAAAYFFRQPWVWWEGLQAQAAHAARGHIAFFLGQYSTTGWWTYFPVAFLIKTPVGTLLLIAASVVAARAGRPFGRREVLFLLVPIAILTAVLVASRLNTGIRYMLFLHPFLFVLASRVMTIRLRRGWIVPAFVGLALAATGASSLRHTPHQLAYFNELVGGPGEGYRYLGDSNVDWGQSLKELKAFLDRQRVPSVYLSYFGPAAPQDYGIRHQNLSLPLWSNDVDLLPPDLPRELLAISVTNLQGLAHQGGPVYQWLHHRTPIAKIGASIFVYDVTDDAEAHLELARIYRSHAATLRDVLTRRPELVSAYGDPDDRYAPAIEVELRKALRLDPTNEEAARLLAALRRRP